MVTYGPPYLAVALIQPQAWRAHIIWLTLRTPSTDIVCSQSDRPLLAMAPKVNPEVRLPLS